MHSSQQDAPRSNRPTERPADSSAGWPAEGPVDGPVEDSAGSAGPSVEVTDAPTGSDGERTVAVQVYYYAAARAAAGTESETLQLPAGSVMADAAATLRERHNEQLARVLDVASFLVDGVAARDRRHTLAEGARIDILPPFAGG